jgi:hypothetical protein
MFLGIQGPMIPVFFADPMWVQKLWFKELSRFCHIIAVVDNFDHLPIQILNLTNLDVVHSMGNKTLTINNLMKVTNIS